jgi:hypothetical protein
MTTHSIDEAAMVVSLASLMIFCIFQPTLTVVKVSSKLGILVEGHLRCIGSPVHLHKRFSRHVTVNAQCANFVALEAALRSLDAHMKLAEVVRRSRVYLLSKNVDQIALLQCLEKLHSEGMLQVKRRPLPS